MLNNYFFPDTAYQLIGLYEQVEVLYAVVEQKIVESDSMRELEKVKLKIITKTMFFL